MKRLFITLLFIGILSLTSCKWSDMSKSVYQFDDSQNYVGTSNYQVDSSLISSIEIDWPNGEVKFIPSTTNMWEINETCVVDLEDETKFQYYLDGTTIRIQYVAFGTLYDKYSVLNKSLEVKVPSSFERCKINLVASDCIISNVSMDSLTIVSISGDVLLENVKSNEQTIMTSSGSITCNSCETYFITANSVSGSLLVRVDTIISSISFHSVSGDIQIYLDDNMGYKCDFTSVSGGYHTSKIEETKYSYGAEDIKVTFDSISGSLSIRDLSK